MKFGMLSVPFQSYIFPCCTALPVHQEIDPWTKGTTIYFVTIIEEDYYMSSFLSLHVVKKCVF